MENQQIANIRKEYKLKSLMENDVQANPFDQFKLWWDEAINSNVDEVNAMTLATNDGKGKPSARIVLLKGFTNEGFIFYTNYDSKKGKELKNNGYAALVFFWAALERQIRIEGSVWKVDEELSCNYFKTRPKASQIAALASPQSQVIVNRAWLDEREKELSIKYADEEVPYPPNWGGYIVKPIMIEFWQGRPSRLHDRIQYTLQKDEVWKIDRLAP